MIETLPASLPFPALRAAGKQGSSLGAQATSLQGSHREVQGSREAAPTVLISNLDPAPLPPHAPALKLAELARTAGWYVRVGYAMAEVPAHHHLNGNLAKPAYVLETIGVQYRRPDGGGRAMWHREAGSGWKFESAFIGTEAFGWSRSGKTKLRSILEGIME